MVLDTIRPSREVCRDTKYEENGPHIICMLISYSRSSIVE